MNASKDTLEIHLSTITKYLSFVTSELYVLMFWLSYLDLLGTVVLQEGRLPSQWPQFETAFQHL